MTKLTGLLLALALSSPMFPQAMPKATPTPAPRTAKPRPAPVPARTTGSCAHDYYRNSRGVCVHRPVQSQSVPAGASAQCRDGSYSFSQTRRGTCSHHGGVAKWL